MQLDTGNKHRDAADISQSEPLILRVPVEANPRKVFGDWVETPLVKLIGDLQEMLLPKSSHARSPVRAVVLLEVPRTRGATRSAAINALVEGVRGVVGAITMELGSGIRLNSLITFDANDNTTAETLAFLASDGAGFVAGSTFDLRRD